VEVYVTRDRRSPDEPVGEAPPALTVHTLKGVLTKIRRGDRPEEDPELLQRLDEAFGRHAAKLYRYVRRELRAAPPQQVEEIVQDVLAEAWVQLPRYEAIEHFSAFLFALARNRCANARRKRSDVLTEDGILDGGSVDHSALAQLVDEERNALIEEAARNVLDESDQELVVLRWVLDYSLDEVAERIGLPGRNEVRVALFRCKRRMQKEVQRLLAERGVGPSFLG
jgi:RNA polymerase sigma factor (sigma-70 family)